MNETKVCRNPDCKAEYEPKYWEAMGLKLIIGMGLCPDCARKEGEELEAKEKAQRDAEIMGIRRNRRQECGIPPMFMTKDFSNFKAETDWQKRAFKRCWDYAENYPINSQRPRGYPSHYIFSEQSWGVGKTHLSCAIAHRIFDRWTGEGRCHIIEFVSEPDLFRSIRATYSFTREEKQYRESEDDIIRGLIFADLLILDDVGKEKPRDPTFVQRILFAIIDGRYKNDLPMIMTANLQLPELRQHLGTGGSDEASYDRFWEMTRDKEHRIKMDGESYRRI